MSVDLSQFIPSFLEESFEGLELMESSLLNLQPGDHESIHSIFRAAHSIKGGAGTFGFNSVTEFTHLVETLLDEMRDGRREVAPNDVEILLTSVDCMRLLIEAARDDEDYDQEKVAQTTKKLEQTLSVNSDDNSTVQAASENSEQTPAMAKYNIHFVPEHNLAKTGNDPLFLFSALAELGELTIKAVTSELPALTDIDPQELYLSWNLTLTTEATIEEIQEIFEWVEDECELKITQIDSDKTTNKDVSNEEPEQADTPASVTTSQSSDNNVEQVNVLSERASKEQTAKPKTKAKAEVGSIRVGVDKVDNLINLVGELVITQSMLSELGNDFQMDKIERLTSGLEQLLQNTKELQESVMRIRMLPISFAFNRFPRLVHDLAIKTGKAMELVIKGEQTELDKTVMEQIGDPLVHLVRNAVTMA